MFQRHTLSEQDVIEWVQNKMLLIEWVHTLALLPEKGSIREVARVTSHDKNTICKWLDVAETHAKQANEYFLRDLALCQVEVDEIWFYKKRIKESRKP